MAAGRDEGGDGCAGNSREDPEGQATTPEAAHDSSGDSGVTPLEPKSFVRQLSRLGSSVGRRLSRTWSLDPAPSLATAEAVAQARWQRISSAEMLEGSLLDAETQSWVGLRNTLAVSS